MHQIPVLDVLALPFVGRLRLIIYFFELGGYRICVAQHLAIERLQEPEAKVLVLEGAVNHSFGQGGEDLVDLALDRFSQWVPELEQGEVYLHEVLSSVEGILLVLVEGTGQHTSAPFVFVTQTVNCFLRSPPVLVLVQALQISPGETASLSIKHPLGSFSLEGVG